MNDGNLGLGRGRRRAAKVCRRSLLTSSLHSMIRALRFARTFSLKILVQEHRHAVLRDLPGQLLRDAVRRRIRSDEPARLHYVNAGHEPPFVMRKTGPPFPDDLSGGERSGDRHAAGSSYRESVVSLNPGDILVAYTDGLCETHQPRGRGMGMAAAAEDRGGLRRSAGSRHCGRRHAVGGSLLRWRAAERRRDSLRGPDSGTGLREPDAGGRTEAVAERVGPQGTGREACPTDSSRRVSGCACTRRPNCWPARTSDLPPGTAPPTSSPCAVR